MPKFLGEIVQNGGDFALLDSSNVRGGFMQVKTLEDRDNIIPDKLKIGMLVFVEEENRIYKYRGDAWTLWKVSGNDLDGVTPLSLNTTVKEVTEEDNYYKIIFEDGIFLGNDIVGYDIQDDLSGTYFKVEYVREGAAYISKNSIPPKKYQTVYHMGNTSDRSRQLVLMLHEYNGAIVLSQFLNRAIEGINTNYFFRLGQHGVNSWKVYGEDVYFKGTFIDEKGRNLSDLITINQETLDTGLAGIRREFGYENLLNNPFFIDGMDCWLTRNTAQYFKANGKWVMTNKTLLSTKRDGAYVIIENGQAVLRLVNGFISQKNENLKKITDLDNTEPPYYVTLIFNYKPITAGTLKAVIRYKDGHGIKYQYTKAQQDLTPSDKYATWKSTFLWDGLGDFTIEYDGEIKIQTLVLKMNEVKNFEQKYSELFEYSSTLVQMAKEYLKNA